MAAEEIPLDPVVLEKDNCGGIAIIERVKDKYLCCAESLISNDIQ